MMGGGGAMGQGGGLMKRFKAFRPDPAVEGRRIQIEGLPDEVEDSAVTKYFQVKNLYANVWLNTWTHNRGLVLSMAGRRDGIEPRARSPTRSLAWLITLSSNRQIIFRKILSLFVSRKKSHTVGGHVVTIARAEPEPEPPGAEEEEEDEHGCTMFRDMPQEGEDHGLSMVRKMKMTLEGALQANEDGAEGELI